MKNINSIEELPVGTITIASSSSKYENIYIEIPKNNSCWVHFYLKNSKIITIPTIQVESIEWKEKWRSGVVPSRDGFYHPKEIDKRLTF